MGDMREVFDDMREHKKRRHKRNLESANDTGWTKHTEYHWTRMLNDARIDYWPTRNKWRFLGKTYTGDVNTWLAKRDPNYTLLVSPRGKSNNEIWEDMGYKKVDPNKVVVDFTKQVPIENTQTRPKEGTIYYKGEQPPWEDNNEDT